LGLGAGGWLLATTLLAGPRASGLTEAPRLAAVYDAILAGQFDRAETQLAMACPPAPAEACAALRAEAMWWQIQIDPDDKSLDPKLETLTAAAINAAGAWTEREPKRAEPWFYLAAAYTPLVQLRVLRHERVSAARAGSKIKDALEQALALDPTLADANLGIGLYHYYAGVAPLYAKLLRWMLWLPGGDREAGLKQILAARDHGVLLAGEADFQLAQIYQWYENRARDALALYESLDARFPENPVFLERIAIVHDDDFHDLDASIAAWTRLRDRARDHHVTGSAVVFARADKNLQQLIARRAKK
jgi:hypothetical protein